MAGSAINSVALLSSRQRCGDCLRIRAGRKFVAIGVAMLAGKKVAVGIQLFLVDALVVELRNGAGNGIAGRSAVRIELAGAQRNKLGLVMHVLPAAGKNSHARRRKQGPGNTDLCRTINTAPP